MKKKFRKKNKARKLALQSIYGWCFTNNDILDIEREIIKHKNKNKIDVKYFSLLIANISQRTTSLDYIIKNNLFVNTQITLMENIIIKIALFEIIFNNTLSFKIIINEALILASKFCSKKSYMLVNKILDNIIKSYGLLYLMSR